MTTSHNAPHRKLLPGVLLAIILFLPPCAWAQEITSPPGVPYIRVHGESTVSAPPDRAQMDIGVVTQDATAKAVADRNAKQSAQLIDQLKTVIRAAEIKTINFSVNPNYRYPKDAPPTITGYTATNTIRLDSLQIGDVPKIIDIATRAGASNINRLNFTLSNENRLRAEALSQAAKQARDAAQALASALSLRIGKVLRVEEGQPVIISPLRQTEFALAKTQGAAALPVEPGNIEVHANVDVTFELTP